MISIEGPGAEGVEIPRPRPGMSTGEEVGKSPAFLYFFFNLIPGQDAIGARMTAVVIRQQELVIVEGSAEIVESSA